jgi:hypothetical protein
MTILIPHGVPYQEVNVCRCVASTHRAVTLLINDLREAFPMG